MTGRGNAWLSTVPGEPSISGGVSVSSLRYLGEVTRSGLAIIDSEWRIQYVNSFLLELLRLDSGDMVGRKCYEIVHGFGRPIPGCPGCRCVADGKPAELVWKEPGIGKWLRMRALPVEPRGTAQATIVHSFQDITSELRRQDNLEAMYRFSQVLSADLHIGQILGRALEEISRIAGDSGVTIGVALADEDSGVFTILDSRGPLKDEVTGVSLQPYELPALSTAPAACRRARVISGISRMHWLPETGTDGGCLLLLPLATGNHAIGYLFLADPKRNKPPQDMVFLLEPFAFMLASALDNAGAFSLEQIALHRASDHLELLSRLLIDSPGGPCSGEWLQTAARNVCLAVGADGVALLLQERDKDAAIVVAWCQRDGSPSPYLGGRIAPVSRLPLMERVMRLGEVVSIEDSGHLPPGRERRLARLLGIRSALMVPVHAGEDVSGCLCILCEKGGNPFLSSEVRTARAVAASLALQLRGFATGGGPGEDARQARKGL